MKQSIIKGLTISVAAVMLTSVMAPPVSAATSPAVTWKVSSLLPATTYTTSAIATTNSTGAKTWSVSGACTIKSGKVTTKNSGACTVKLSVKAKAKFASKTFSKRFTVKSSETAGQSNARKSAKQYLDISPFSRLGLIDQLLYEKYTLEDATYGVDIANTDWNAQAGKSAIAYLEISAFSRQGLIDQLLYEKYTQSQAEYGTTKAGL